MNNMVEEAAKENCNKKPCPITLPGLKTISRFLAHYDFLSFNFVTVISNKITFFVKKIESLNKTVFHILAHKAKIQT